MTFWKVPWTFALKGSSHQLEQVSACLAHAVPYLATKEMGCACSVPCLYTTPYFVLWVPGACSMPLHLASVLGQARSAGNGCCPGLSVWLRSVWRVSKSMSPRPSGVSCPITPRVHGGPADSPDAQRQWHSAPLVQWLGVRLTWILLNFADFKFTLVMD